MALDQLAHHAGLARRPECGAALLGLLDLDQAVDDVAALPSAGVHVLVDRSISWRSSVSDGVAGLGFSAMIALYGHAVGSVDGRTLIGSG